MSETKTRPAAHRPGAAGPAEQMTEALAGFLQEFNGFQAEVTSALHQQEERLTMLQAKTMTYGRPILSTAVETEESHKNKAGETDTARDAIFYATYTRLKA